MSTVLPFSSNGTSRVRSAFTLIEVMIAMGIFFVAIFSILALVSTNIRNARKLQQSPVDIGMLYAEMSLTNNIPLGVESGDFGDVFPGYEWTRDAHAYLDNTTNGLVQVDVVVTRRNGPHDEQHMSALFFSPNSAQGLNGGLGGNRPGGIR